MGSIFKMFGPSPIRPIEQHMHKVYLCAKELHPLFEVAFSHDWVSAANLREKIATLKKEADTIKRDLRLHLPTSLFLPVARTDVLELLSAQDRIAIKAKNIANLIVSRQLIIPDSLAQKVRSFLECSLDASKQACKAINELDALLESGFRGNEVKIVEEMIVTLDETEEKAEEKLTELMERIFELEKASSLPPLDLFFLYKLVQEIGDLADHAQTAGARLQILIAR